MLFKALVTNFLSLSLGTSEHAPIVLGRRLQEGNAGTDPAQEQSSEDWEKPVYVKQYEPEEYQHYVLSDQEQKETGTAGTAGTATGTGGAMGDDYEQYMKAYASGGQYTEVPKDYQSYMNTGTKYAATKGAQSYSGQYATYLTSIPEEYKQYMNKYTGSKGSNSTNAAGEFQFTQYTQGGGAGGGAGYATYLTAVPKEYQNYMNKYTGSQDNGTAGAGASGQFNYKQYETQYTTGGGYAGKGGYQQYVNLYEGMAGSSKEPRSESGYQAKEDSQLQGFGKAMNVTFGKYIPGSYQNFASSPVNARVSSGGNGAGGSSTSGTDQGDSYSQYMTQYGGVDNSVSHGGTSYGKTYKDYTKGANQGSQAKNSTSTELLAMQSKHDSDGTSSGGYENYMKQYAGGGSSGGYEKYMNQYAGGSSGDYEKYMKQYAGGSSDGYEKYMNQYTGGSGGGYEKYMKQYAGSYTGSDQGNQDNTATELLEAKPKDDKDDNHESSSGGYEKYMKQYAGGSGGGYEKYMKQYTGGSSGGYEKYMKQYSGGSSGDYEKYMKQYAGGSSGGPGGYDKYMKQYAGSYTSSSDSSGSDDTTELLAVDSTNDNHASSSGGYEKYMKQYAGDYTSSSGGGYDKYMNQYTGGSGGGYEKYMKQYAGSYTGSSDSSGSSGYEQYYQKYLDQSAGASQDNSATQLLESKGDDHGSSSGGYEKYMKQYAGDYTKYTNYQKDKKNDNVVHSAEDAMNMTQLNAWKKAKLEDVKTFVPGGYGNYAEKSIDKEYEQREKELKNHQMEDQTEEMPADDAAGDSARRLQSVVEATDDGTDDDLLQRLHDQSGQSHSRATGSQNFLAQKMYANRAAAAHPAALYVVLAGAFIAALAYANRKPRTVVAPSNLFG